MPDSLRRVRLGALLVAFALASFASHSALAQEIGDDEFVTGPAAAAWVKWKAAMEAVMTRSQPDAAEAAFGELLATEPSPMRLALMAERSVMRNEGAGGVLLFRQDGEADTLKDNGKKVFEMLVAGDEQKNEADDGWYFASVGQFGVSNANFAALVASNPDPVALLEFADRVQRRQQILVTLAGDPIMGDSVKSVLRLLQEGELRVKSDPMRIKQHIARLGGPPRQFENSVARLRDSGEYAIPFLLQALRNPEQKHLAQAILRTIPQIDRGALNPLVMATRTADRSLREYVVRALGQIGYWQSVPYLSALREAQDTPPEIRSAAEASLADLQAHGVTVEAGQKAADAFYKLAQMYYEDQKSVAADMRQDKANVWYWRDDLAQNVEVPTAIFNEIMTMRCCEEALRLDPNMKPALSLWVAANLRREAELPEGQKDLTRPDNYPSARYFAQSAGPEYCSAALALGVDRREASVALGAIEALRSTGGPSSIVGDSAGRWPLADALAFQDRMVRIRAALALGNAIPDKTFANSQNLMAVLCEAVALQGTARNALAIDSNADVANAFAGSLRGGDYNVLTDADLLNGLNKARGELPGLDAIVIGSNVGGGISQAITQIRGELKFAAAAIVVVVKKGDRDLVREAVKSDSRVVTLLPEAPAEVILNSVRTIQKANGQTVLTPELATAVSMEAAETLLRLADTNNPLFRPTEVEATLIASLGTKDAALRVRVANVLGFVGSTQSQEAIAGVALNTKEDEAARVAMFAALADAAKRRGNKLGDGVVAQVVKAAESESNMAVRTAASQALGAMNLPSNPASMIIRNQYGG